VVGLELELSVIWFVARSDQVKNNRDSVAVIVRGQIHNRCVVQDYLS
jgi:hypothetical protein